MHIRNLKIGHRLALSFGAVIALLIVLAILSYSRVRALQGEIAATAEQRYPMTVLANQVIRQINNQARSMRTALLLGNPEASMKELEGVQASVAASGLVFERLIKMGAGQADPAVIGSLPGFRQAYLRSMEQFFDLVRGQRLEPAARFLIGEVRPLEKRYTAELDKILQQQDALMKQAGADSITAAEQARFWIVLLALGAGALSVLAAALTTRSITGPLRGALKIAETVAAGDLSSKIAVASSDEAGKLMRSLQVMNASLVATVGQVRGSAAAIAGTADHIAAGNLDLSGRTEAQAHSLHDTTASLEQLTSTVRQNADSALRANQLAAAASDSAAKGGAVVARVVETMDQINASASKIGDIIGVIDGIAFQTNILALNAAVEAARAGEQGRGFAVVASEVRNLAQRSASAAKEIKTLIGDSSAKVDAGSKLVGQAGATMGEIVAGIGRVTDIMGEISAASREQSLGIAQVNQAIALMEDATRQNATLVEHATATSQSLRDQANQLSEAISVFKLDDDLPAAAPGGAARGL
ncbi:MAG: MCP four helix bundle domain-containing protein, partial [Burkholderiaceae bacterium]|nr:MCP four helix bundle domain-containing protein [Burkholderiaceae bacterium]